MGYNGPGPYPLEHFSVMADTPEHHLLLSVNECQLCGCPAERKTEERAKYDMPDHYTTLNWDLAEDGTALGALCYTCVWMKDHVDAKTDRIGADNLVELVKGYFNRRRWLKARAAYNQDTSFTAAWEALA